MNFGQAIEALQQGKIVARAGWNGKNMFVSLVPGHEGDATRNIARTQPFFALKTADGSVQPGWNASTPDVLATDWIIAD